MEHGVDWTNLAWAAGWLVAMAVLFRLGLRLPLRAGRSQGSRVAYALACALAGVAVATLAVAALTLHDSHIDLTRARLHTPAPAALAVARALQSPVKVTYFYQGQDADARRARDMLVLMAKQNSLLAVRAIDPDKHPSLAQTAGVKIYNAAVIETGGRRVLVQGTDESDIAIGIQRALRERAPTLCFIEGHNEYAVDNEEFHTHLEGVAGHSHDDASALVIDTTGHGVGRLRRSLEALGYIVERLPLATLDAIPAHCSVVIDAGPRTTHAPAESALLRAHLVDGGALLLLYDLGFVLEPGLAALLSELGVEALPAVVIDAASHYGTDPQMVAVTGYEAHPITARVAYTFFPGVRPLRLLETAPEVRTQPLMRSGATSTAQALAARNERVPSAARSVRIDPAPGAHVLAVASEGRLAPSSAPFRAVAVGDADFASNSFYPYMANSDLALALVRWLAREDDRATAAPRIPAPALLLLTEAQLRGVFLLALGALPLAALVTGGIIGWRRR